VVIAAVLVLAVGLWMVTHGVTQAYGHRQDHLARTWYSMGDTALREGRLDAAISDLRTALAYSHAETKVRLRLAEALAAAGETRQAQAYLIALWEEQPADGNFNLQLARLSVRQGRMADAQRYYHGAIYGVWNDDAIARRRNVRLELVQFLLARHSAQQAESELIALSADAPHEPKWMLELGALFLEAGDASRALAPFSDVVRVEPRNAFALAGAGQAAYQQQDYSQARQYLERAVALNPQDSRSAQLLQTSHLVLELDPYLARIGPNERARRVLRALEQTQYRLEKCAEQQQITLTSQPSGSPLAIDYAEILALKPRVNRRTLRDDPDFTDTLMQLVFSSQADAASACGQPEGPDLALLLIGRVNGGRR
jgi:tetratricopeptide (TPR) repeat protein